MDEVRRKFFGTLYNTYSFFALYANVDGFTGREPEVPVEKRPEIDRWIISLLNTLIRDVTRSLEDYDPTPARAPFRSSWAKTSPTGTYASTASVSGAAA